MVLEFIESKSLRDVPLAPHSKTSFQSILLWAEVVLWGVSGCSSPTNPANPPKSSPHTEASNIRSKQEEPLKQATLIKTDESVNQSELKTNAAPKKPAKKEENSTTLVLADNARWSDIRLELWSSSHLCEIRTMRNREVQRFQLEITPPCNFVRRNGKLQSFAYPKQNLKGVILISRSPPKPDPQLQQRLDRLGDRGKDCGYETQAILFRPKEVKLAAKVIRKVLMCPAIGADEIFFAEFAGVPPGR